MAEKKNVCMIGPLPPPVTGLSKALDTILTSEECLKAYDFEVIDLGRLYEVSGSKMSLSKVTGLFRLLKRVKQVIHRGQTDTYYLAIAQSTIGVLRDVAILRLIRKDGHANRIVIHLHGGGFRNFYQQCAPWLQRLIQKSYSCVTCAVVLGSSLRNMFEGVLPPEKIAVIPNCVDDEFIVPDAALENRLSSLEGGRALQVLYLSNMIREKGYPDVLEAARICAEHGVNAHFVFAGKFYSEAEEDAFRNMIAQEPYASCVEYAGIVAGEEKLRLLEQSDVFTLPTYYPHEGQPITIIEAMSAGMPVICTNHAGICDLVADGVNGIFVAPQVPQAIAEAVRHYCEDRSLLLHHSRAGRKAALENFTEQQYTDRIIQILK